MKRFPAFIIIYRSYIFWKHLIYCTYDSNITGHADLGFSFATHVHDHGICVSEKISLSPRFSNKWNHRSMDGSFVEGFFSFYNTIIKILCLTIVRFHPQKIGHCCVPNLPKIHDSSEWLVIIIMIIIIIVIIMMMMIIIIIIMAMMMIMTIIIIIIMAMMMIMTIIIIIIIVVVIVVVVVVAVVVGRVLTRIISPSYYATWNIDIVIIRRTRYRESSVFISPIVAGLHEPHALRLPLFLSPSLSCSVISGKVPTFLYYKRYKRPRFSFLSLISLDYKNLIVPPLYISLMSHQSIS